MLKMSIGQPNMTEVLQASKGSKNMKVQMQRIARERCSFLAASERLWRLLACQTPSSFKSSA